MLRQKNRHIHIYMLNVSLADRKYTLKHDLDNNSCL